LQKGVFFHSFPLFLCFEKEDLSEKTHKFKFSITLSIKTQFFSVLFFSSSFSPFFFLVFH